MPGPVIAVAMLWAYLHEPFVLYGTLWILLVAYVTHYLPYGVRPIRHWWIGRHVARRYLAVCRPVSLQAVNYHIWPIAN
jgi:ABC-type Fe3+ transport system permease subunit